MGIPEVSSLSFNLTGSATAVPKGTDRLLRKEGGETPPPPYGGYPPPREPRGPGARG